MKRGEDKHREIIVKLAAEVLPALIPYGIESVEVVFHAGSENSIRGIQYRDGKGCRVTRTSIPPNLIASIERQVVSFIGAGAVEQGEGVLEFCLGSRRVTCKQPRHGTDTYDSTEWIV